MHAEVALPCAAPQAWRPRRRGTAVGCLYLCGPEAGERYCLRLLLRVRGATSWVDLRTVPSADGPVEYATFREACQALGLLADEREADATLAEAADYLMPPALRQMYATLLCYSEVGSPSQLWARHQAALTDDILHEQRQVGRSCERVLMCMCVRERWSEHGAVLRR